MRQNIAAQQLLESNASPTASGLHACTSKPQHPLFYPSQAHTRSCGINLLGLLLLLCSTSSSQRPPLHSSRAPLPSHAPHESGSPPTRRARPADRRRHLLLSSCPCPARRSTRHDLDLTAHQLSLTVARLPVLPPAILPSRVAQMDRSGAKARAGHRKREPLGDGSSRANIPASPARTLKNSSLVSPSSSTSSPIPHHESVNNNGALRSRNAPIEEDSDEDYEDDDKRVSQHSTAASDASAKGMKRKTHIGPWQLGASIGGGSVGVVRKVRHALTGQLAAVKIISKSNADMSRAESMANFAKTYKPAGGEGVTLPFGIEREVVIMKLLEHRNIVRLYDVWENRSQL